MVVFNHIIPDHNAFVKRKYRKYYIAFMQSVHSVIETFGNNKQKMKMR